MLTYNTFLMSTSLYPNWGQQYRAQAIASADFFQGHDVVVLAEAFDNAASDALIANIDSHGSEYQALLTNGNLAPASARTGWPYSFDTADNSVAAYRYPGEPKEDLDYVLYRADHARPQQYTNQVLRVHSAPWTVSSWGKSYTYTDLSDHYPLTAH